MALQQMSPPNPPAIIWGVDASAADSNDTAAIGFVCSAITCRVFTLQPGVRGPPGLLLLPSFKYYMKPLGTDASVPFHL